MHLQSDPLRGWVIMGLVDQGILLVENQRKVVVYINIIISPPEQFIIIVFDWTSFRKLYILRLSTY